MKMLRTKLYEIEKEKQDSAVVFQATGKIVPSFLLSISRQGVVFLLALVVCVHLFQYQGVLMAQAVADILSAALALGLLAASRDIIACPWEDSGPRAC